MAELTQDGWFCNTHQEAFYAYRLAHPDCPWKLGRPKALDNLSVDRLLRMHIFGVYRI